MKANDGSSFRIDPNTIESFTLADAMFEVTFKNGAGVLKFPARTTVFSHEGTIQMRVVPILPSSILVGGTKIADGKPRCADCDCLLEGETVIGGYCAACCLKLEAVQVAIAACKVVKVSKPENVVMGALIELNPTNAAEVTDDVLLTAALKGKRL